MPWITPTLSDVRRLARDGIAAHLPGADATIPNSVLRVLSDENAGLAHQVLLYLDWLALQLMADTAEKEWLDRHAAIWVGGRLPASFAVGTANSTGIAGTVVPIATRMQGGTSAIYETTAQVTLGAGPTVAPIKALTAGNAGNLEPGSGLSITSGVSGLDGSATVISLQGGVDEESDTSLRDRVLFRIRKPPMGGSADDYVRWAREVPGVTRVWASPHEQGVGSMTVRFMMDDVRKTTSPLTSGLPNSGDIAAVVAHLDTLRPVAMRDLWVSAPIPEPINFTVSNLDFDSTATRAALEASVAEMIFERAAPGYTVNGAPRFAQTIYREWVSAAILAADGVFSFDLTMDDHVMPNYGYIGVMGTATYA